jgi:ectoine hydroxylase-related dioxygenase (phytanoyl-CoA dioxygenase family)
MLAFEGTLSAAGVTPHLLSVEQKASLEQQGFVVVPGALDKAWLTRLRRTFDEEDGGSQHGNQHVVVSRELADFDAWLALASHSWLLAAAWEILARPFRLADLRGGGARPGYGADGLHADWLTRRAGEPAGAASAIWMLDDLTTQNGAPRVVPRSHLQNRPIPRPLSQASTRHPEQQIVTGSAGSVLMLNGHIWHSGTRNRSTECTRTIETLFVAAEHRRAYRHIEDANWGGLVKNRPWIPPSS